MSSGSVVGDDGTPLATLGRDNDSIPVQSSWSTYEDDQDDAPLLKEELEIGHSRKRSFRIRRLLVVCLSSSILVVLLLLLFKSYFATRTKLPGPYWKGYDKIENYFAFGDSWTDTHFWSGGDQPSDKNPLGNPEWPGFTSTNGLNYVGYLTGIYNQSFIKTFNMGISGATIDTRIDDAFLFDWNDFRHHVEKFKEVYTTNETAMRVPLGWRPENTLFSTFYGINDFSSFNRSKHSLDEAFSAYERYVSELYDSSARNFLIINVPPVDNAPVNRGHVRKDSASIGEFNTQIRSMIQRLQRRNSDITIFEFDAHDLMNRVMEEPRSTLYTAGYKNTADCCEVYDQFSHQRVATVAEIEECDGLRPNEYLWLNQLHVTEPIHEAMAVEIVKMLTKGT